MPCPHNEISIVQRSHRQSAVAAAAYQSGEKLFCEYDQEVKHYPEKRGIVHNEILLPANAPLEYTDRNTLWNAAEAVEKQWNSQLARRWVLSIPREIPPDQYAALVRDFCRQQFVSKGMCVDFAIHDKGDGNPHAHVMLTMRAMDERGKWLPKSRKVYELDKNGERIKLPSGRWKSHKEDTVDWNDRKYGEIWRHEWEVIQNRYLEANNRPERVDLRSYERQGLDIIPTVHEGAAVRQMEKRGIQTNIGNLNREIKAANSLMKSIRQLIKNLKGWIAELSEKRNELLAQKAAEEAVFLPNLLMKYMEIRKAERSSWTRAGQSRGTSKDLKAVSEALSYLQRKGLSTVEDHHFCHRLRAYDRDLLHGEPCAHPHGNMGQPRAIAHGTELPEMPVRIGLSRLSHPHLRGNLRRADPERGDFRGCHQLHLEHCGLHCPALFQPVQDQFRDEIRSRSALKEVLYWLRIFPFPVT